MLMKLKKGISPTKYIYDRCFFNDSIWDEPTEERIKKLREFDSKYWELI